MLAIVLSGGGSKGAYEIGVWKAIKKLKIKYDIVTGTSVGALNGAMMVQKDFKKALKIWENINYDNIIDNSNFNQKKQFTKYYVKNFVKNGGASINALETLIDTAISEKKFFKSKINFGLITYNFSKLKPMQISKGEIKPNYLKKYIIASATCFPFFKKKEINNEHYIDGGYYDNLPINLAISLGATEILAVDLKAIGIKQKVKKSNVKIKYISPNIDTGNMLIFEKELSRKNIKHGYNDTMKAYKKLDGKNFTFKKGQLDKNYKKYANKYYQILKMLFSNDKLKKILENEKVKTDYFNNLLEKIGLLYLVDRSNIYKIKTYNKILKQKINNITCISNKKLLNVFKKEQIVKYFYELMKDDIYKNRNKIIKYSNLLHDEIEMAIYLYIIK